MPDKKISQLDPIDKVRSDSPIAVVDLVAGITKKTNLENIFTSGYTPIKFAVNTLTDLENIPTDNLPLGTIIVVLAMQGRSYEWAGDSWLPLIINHPREQPPGANDDFSNGYLAGDVWTDKQNKHLYYCVDDTTGSAVWEDSSTSTPTNDLSPFTGDVDGQGTQTNKYATVKEAYAAGRKDLFTSASIDETANAVLTNADFLYLKIGQNNKWNLGDFQIDGAALGERVTIELADASSIMEFNSLAADKEFFANFDPASTLIIKGNGGIINNLSAFDGCNICTEGKLIVENIQINLPNKSSGGLCSNNLSSISNMVLNGGGNNCEIALLIHGGEISNIVFSGAWKTNAFLNTVTSPSNTNGLTYLSEGPAVYQVMGNLTNVKSSMPAELVLSVSSNSNVSNVTAASVVLLSGQSNISFSNLNLSGTISFANDNTNSNISFVGCTFAELPEIYGDSISFINCHFKNGLKTNTGSSGNISSSTSGIAAILDGLFYRSNNDENIGNTITNGKTIVMLTLDDSPYTAKFNEILVGSVTTGQELIIAMPLIQPENYAEEIDIKLTGLGSITLTAESGQQFDGGAAPTFTNNESIKFVSSDNDWLLF